MKLQPLVALGVVALFLYWVVQDPVGAASVIHQLFSWVIDMLQLIASRIVRFLGALSA
jgi:hypothetical protein